ncbi:MAG TPA: ATP-dependent DNA helicase [Desulfobulbaceae bacterium]|nr:ATP-dependent DNA helicase [Desulfobulbaceae bacterium]
MRDVFGSEGVLAQHLKGYESRPGQQEMAAAISALLHSREETDDDNPVPADSLVVEAETGLGKTLAYLVPAVLTGRRVVISTNTRNLQDQILEREIPFIKEYIDPDLKATCVKGRQNYLCLYRWHQMVSTGQGELFDDSASKRLADWIRQTTFGDRVELDWLPSQSPLWQMICCQSHFCLGTDCPDGHHCFLNRLRREAATSRLLVVNHHLLFSDLAVRRGGYGEVLPRYEAIIFDEAHHVEKVATQFFGRSFSRYQVRDLAGDLERSALSELGRKQRKEFLQKIHALSGKMEQFAALFPVERGRFPLRDIWATDTGLMEKRDELLRAFDQLADQLESASGGREPWAQYRVRCLELQAELAFITAEAFDDLPEEENRYIHWFERREKNIVLSATPVDVAEELQKTLFSSVAACVFTSATLTTGGDFSYFFKRLGLPEETCSLSFPSPFDYADRTLLYIPDADFPEPTGTGYQQALHGRIQSLIKAAGGRALVLFTSFKAMDAARHALKDSLGFPLLCQGTAPRHELLRRFSEDIGSVLFAVASFWEGVDIAGESLSLIIIDKLPFEVPTDPVIMARMSRIKAGGGNPFYEFQVPRAILSLRQGVGRLMRSSGDRGVIAVLDARLFSKNYGKRFLGSLPPSPLVRDLQAVKSFFIQECDDNQ